MSSISVEKALSICLAGLLLNLGGSFVVKTFNLPFFFDTSGTIFVAALGSYMPGIVVGFLTNLLKAPFDSFQMYFASVSILIAIFSTFFARKGFFDSLRKTLLLIPLLTLFTGGCSLVIESFLNSASFLASVEEFNLNFADNFWSELFDKAISILFVFFLLKFTPAQIKKYFRTLGRRQAPLSEEMKQGIGKENYLSSSLRTKLLLMLMLSSFLVSFSVAFISYLLFKDAAVSDRIKSVDSMDAVILSEINPYRIGEYMALGRQSEDYKAVEEKLYSIKNSSPDVKYLYVYRFSEDGCHVVFDLNTAMIEADKPGEVIEFDDDVLPYKDDLLAGRPIPPIISDDEYGYLLTIYKPLYDAEGVCQCYVAIDFSLDPLAEYAHGFIIKLLVLFIGCFTVIFSIGLWFIENNIILPVNTMAYCARHFSYDDAAAREKHIELIRSLKIRTGDEIENLYQALLRTTENILRYLEHLHIAKTKVADMRVKFFAMDEIAHKDSLTGVKNKTAYAEWTDAIDKKISAGTADFCIVMVDVNFLKRVNDTYGHERGNDYLRNACKLVCAVFGEKHVYRIGGDEFVVVIEGEKVSLCKYFVAQFKFEMERKNSNTLLEPWEKISAAVGVAYYEPAEDKTADEVFKRADKLMYENKLAMKAARIN